MAQLPEVLEWYSLTEMVNEFKPTNSFLKRLAFGNERVLPTDNIVYRIQRKGRKVAPFVERGREAVLSGGYSAEEVSFTAPSISLRRPLDAVDLLFRRHAGDQIFTSGGDQQAAAAREVALQLQALNDEIEEAEEWLSAQAIQGTVSYSTPDEASYTINMNKPAGNTIVLGTPWDAGSNVNVRKDVLAARRVMHDEVQLNPMVCVLGAEATDAFLDDPLIQTRLDNRNTQMGTLLLDGDINEAGALYLGTIFGIEFWSYTRQVQVGSTTVDLVRPKYAEFLNVSASARNTMFYAGIADLDANDQGNIATKRFSKSWREKNPSVQQIMVQSRPLPIMQRPGSSVSMKVVSG